MSPDFLTLLPPDLALTAMRVVHSYLTRAFCVLTTLLASSSVVSKNGSGVSAQYLLGLGKR